MKTSCRHSALLLGMSFLLIASPRARAADPPTLLVFSDGTNSPRYSEWNGSTWAAPASMASVGAEPQWVVLQGGSRRRELACATLDSDNDVNVMFFQSDVWTSPVEVCSNTGQSATRVFDVAYEQQSGDALLAYVDDSENNIGFVTYDGITLSGESDLSKPNPASSPVLQLRMYASPLTDQIILVIVHQVSVSSKLYAAVWDGAAWGTWKSLHGKISTSSEVPFDVAFEGVSGQALVVYEPKGAPKPKARSWDGATWSNEADASTIGAEGRWLRLAADSASDQVVLVALDEDNDINVNVWNGSAWGSNLEIETEAAAFDKRQFDVAFQNGGGVAVLAYHETGQTNLRYRTWNGASWSAEQAGVDIGDEARIVQLRTGRRTGEIFIAASDEGDDLAVFRWDGSAMTGFQILFPTLGGLPTTEQFMIGLAPQRRVLSWREVRNVPSVP